MLSSVSFAGPFFRIFSANRMSTVLCFKITFCTRLSLSSAEGLREVCGDDRVNCGYKKQPSQIWRHAAFLPPYLVCAWHHHLILIVCWWVYSPCLLSFRCFRLQSCQLNSMYILLFVWYEGYGLPLSDLYAAVGKHVSSSCNNRRPTWAVMMQCLVLQSIDVNLTMWVVRDYNPQVWRKLRHPICTRPNRPKWRAIRLYYIWAEANLKSIIET